MRNERRGTSSVASRRLGSRTALPTAIDESVLRRRCRLRVGRAARPAGVPRAGRPGAAHPSDGRADSSSWSERLTGLSCVAAPGQSPPRPRPRRRSCCRSPAATWLEEKRSARAARRRVELTRCSSRTNASSTSAISIAGAQHRDREALAVRCVAGAAFGSSPAVSAKYATVAVSGQANSTPRAESVERAVELRVGAIPLTASRMSSGPSCTPSRQATTAPTSPPMARPSNGPSRARRIRANTTRAQRRGRRSPCRSRTSRRPRSPPRSRRRPGRRRRRA